MVRDLAPHSSAPFEISVRATRNEHSRGCGCDRAGIADAEQRLPFMHHLEKTQAAKLVDWMGLGHKLPQLQVAICVAWIFCYKLFNFVTIRTVSKRNSIAVARR